MGLLDFFHLSRCYSTSFFYLAYTVPGSLERFKVPTRPFIDFNYISIIRQSGTLSTKVFNLGPENK